jgi:hypothetical protein
MSIAVAVAVDAVLLFGCTVAIDPEREWGTQPTTTIAIAKLINHNTFLLTCIIVTPSRRNHLIGIA